MRLLTRNNAEQKKPFRPNPDIATIVCAIHTLSRLLDLLRSTPAKKSQQLTTLKDKLNFLKSKPSKEKK